MNIVKLVDFKYKMIIKSNKKINSMFQLFKKYYFLILMLMCFSVSIAQADQNDFYGTWNGSISYVAYRSNNENVIIIIKYTISAKSLYLEITSFSNENSLTEKVTAEIITWIETVNNNFLTRNDFPDGFIIRVKGEDGIISSMTFYISKDKKQLIDQALNLDNEPIIILSKQ